MDTTIIKVDSAFSPKGKQGEKYLAMGKKIAMRLWENEKPMSQPKPESIRDYETVGFVIKGTAELYIGDQMVILNQGDSWVVPAGTAHTYKILETFTAVEATTPPCSVHGRDSAPTDISHH